LPLLTGIPHWEHIFSIMAMPFLLEASRAGADVMGIDGEFRYPSYVQDIMGPMCFDFGFGPFRWFVAPMILQTWKKLTLLLQRHFRIS